jgi:hypothetical protein
MTRTLLPLTAVVLFVAMAPIAAQDAASGVCIAVPLPAAQGVEGSATDVGVAVRDLFTGYLRGPAIQVVPLDARLASQAPEEARQKGCAHVLLVTVTKKRHGGGGTLGRVLGHAGSTVAWQLPAGRVGTAVTRGVALAGAQAVADLASTTRAKDEMKLEYRVTSADGGALLQSQTDKLKASVDGEDLLTPLVRRASESIVAALSSSR